MNSKMPRHAAAIASLFFVLPNLHAANTGMRSVPSIPGLGSVAAPILKSPAVISGAPSLQLPQLALPAAPTRLELPAGAAVPQAASANESLKAITNELSAAAAGNSDKAPAQTLNQAFDGFEGNRFFNGGVGDGGHGSGGNGGSNNNNDGSNRQPPQNRSRRVVMILDTFNGEAPESVVKSIERLLDDGSHVVFVTARPNKGNGSAESMLVSKLKARMNNPLIVVSYNGAVITPHTPTRSENGPKPIIDSLGGFPQASMDYLRKSGQAVMKRLGVTGQIEEFGYPSLESPYIYGGRIPEGVDAQQWAGAYNRMLRSAKYPYKVETFTDAEGRSWFMTQSTALRLNTGRIFNALYAQFPQLNPENEPVMGLKSDQVIVFGNPAQAPSFMRGLDSSVLKGEGFYLQGVTDWASLDRGIGSMLGLNGLDKVFVNRYDVRDYVEWRDRRSKFGAPGAGGMRRAPAGKKKDGVMTPFEALVSRYRGTVIKHVLDTLLDYMRRGNYAEATPEAAQELLKEVWRNPRQHRIFVDPEIELAMSSEIWRARSKDYKGGPLEVAAQYLRNYYHRNFPNYPRGVGERVAGVHLALARDGKQSVNLHYPNPHTGQDFVVGVKLDHQEIEEDDKGYMLVAHVYRTGREPYFREFYEGVETSIAGRALLEAWAEKRADGKWYVNGEPDPRVKVVFHYNTRDLPKIFTAAELDATVPQVASIITQREADPEYQAWLAEKQAKMEAAKLAAEKKLGRLKGKSSK